MEINYERQTLEHPNPIARLAHTARFRFSKELVLSQVNNGFTLVDYGCGQGRFLNELAKELKQKSINKYFLYGYDAYMSAEYDGYTVSSNLDAFSDESIEMITCLEVCEHLDNRETDDFIDFVLKKLRRNGLLLVTVPIMIGPALIVKELSRSILFRRIPDIRTYDLILGSVFGKVPPRAENIKTSHRGYDWRITLKTLKKSSFSLESLLFSPIPLISWYGNSQAIMLFRKT